MAMTSPGKKKSDESKRRRGCAPQVEEMRKLIVGPGPDEEVQPGETFEDTLVSQEY
ncbi:MAG: hypothetical protein ACEQSB_01590 [Undibacterium sp.]